MRLSFTRGALAASFGVLAGWSALPKVVSAQGGVSAGCSIDPNSPKELAMTELKIQQARSAPSPAARLSTLKDIIKELDTKPERFAKNPAGYNQRMAQVLALLAVEPGVGYTPVRGSIGFVTNPTETIDLLAKLDESFKAIVAAIPACETDIKAQRQNEVWLAVTKRALDASNSGQMDTAEFYAKKSLMLSTESPYPHYVLANVANTKKDRAGAMAHWKMVISVAGTDTTYRELRNSSLYLLSVNQLEAAEASAGAQKVSLGREAAASFKSLIAATPDSPDVPNMMQSWSDALRLAGDTAGVTAVYADLLAKPGSGTDVSLTMGGVIATRANKTDDAIKLFEAAVAKNPYSRDGLRNLAATYYAKEQFMKMFAPSQKLVSIDPNNNDAWMMFAYASQGLAKAVKAPPAEKKGVVLKPDEKKALDAASAAATAEKRAWTDSLVKYQTIAEALPVKVEVTSFLRTAKESTLGLQFEQMLATDGTYNVTVEFIDAAGTVVGTATQSVGPLKKGAPKGVTFKAAAQNAAGYRYKALK